MPPQTVDSGLRTVDFRLPPHAPVSAFYILPSAFPEEMQAYSKQLKGVGVPSAPLSSEALAEEDPPSGIRPLPSARVVPGRAKSWMGALDLRHPAPIASKPWRRRIRVGKTLR